MNYILIVAIAVFTVSCNNSKTADETKEAASSSTNKTDAAQSQADLQAELKSYDKFLGSFVGSFGDNKITMLVTRVTKDSVYGRSIVGGNDRPFAGSYTHADNTYHFSASEPGDHKDDGVFTWTTPGDDQNRLTGEWKPFAENRPKKQFVLEKKSFTYQPTVGDYPESSTRLLKPADVENLMKEDLEFMRNEIFARHGYCFNRKHLRQQFEMQDWYVPNTVDIKGHLTEIEKKNIALIKRYEKYAEEYGDEYGR